MYIYEWKSLEVVNYLQGKSTAKESIQSTQRRSYCCEREWLNQQRIESSLNSKMLWFEN